MRVDSKNHSHKDDQDDAYDEESISQFMNHIRHQVVFRIVDQLSRLHRDWSGEKLYQVNTFFKDLLHGWIVRQDQNDKYKDRDEETSKYIDKDKTKSRILQKAWRAVMKDKDND